jgi:hypothetical protein
MRGPNLLLGCLLLLATTSQAGIVKEFPGGYITFLAGRWGTNPASYRTNLPYGIHAIPPADSYVLDHWIKYRPGWLDGQGGKFAGLGGGSASTGCVGITPAGWSVRYMWDPMRAYLYHQDRVSECGDSDAFQPNRLEVDRWYRLTQRVQVNTPNQRNGVVEVWVDGHHVYRRTNLRLRGAVSAGTARVDRFVLGPIRGGKDASWAVARDTTVDFGTFYLLDCIPAFTSGSPTTAPTCGDGISLPGSSTATTPALPTPRHLRIVGP